MRLSLSPPNVTRCLGLPTWRTSYRTGLWLAFLTQKQLCRFQAVVSPQTGTQAQCDLRERHMAAGKASSVLACCLADCYLPLGESLNLSGSVFLPTKLRGWKFLLFYFFCILRVIIIIPGSRELRRRSPASPSSCHGGTRFPVAPLGS